MADPGAEPAARTEDGNRSLRSAPECQWNGAAGEGVSVVARAGGAPRSGVSYHLRTMDLRESRPAPEWSFEERVTVASFVDLSSAWIALGMLEAHGIPAQLSDQHTAGINWACVPAIGGVRLHTGPQHARDAARLLREVPATVLHDSGCARYFRRARRRKRAVGLVALLLLSPWLAAVGVFGLLFRRRAGPRRGDGGAAPAAAGPPQWRRGGRGERGEENEEDR
jgi:hypothetical protein